MKRDLRMIHKDHICYLKFNYSIEVAQINQINKFAL